eukprot:scaffold150092_cov24-Tisochrysis_lutea.AAC.1
MLRLTVHAAIDRTTSESRHACHLSSTGAFHPDTLSSTRALGCATCASCVTHNITVPNIIAPSSLSHGPMQNLASRPPHSGPGHCPRPVRDNVHQVGGSEELPQATFRG